MNSPYQVVRDFEAALCEYTGAPYAVTVNSCTMALLLACRYRYIKNQKCYPDIDDAHGVASLSNRKEVIIPKRTYVSVPQSIKHAGYDVTFSDEEWYGYYYIDPIMVVDSARWFSSRMYSSFEHDFVCCSFHATKTLGDTQGGAILHDDPEADKWFRRARFDGRTEGVAPKDDHFDMVGYHCYMSPDVAARLLLKLSVLPKYNSPLPNDDYPDLSKFEVFR